VLSYKFPTDIMPPQTTNPVCTPSGSNFKKVSCTRSGKILNVTFQEFKEPTGVFSWVVSGIRNPVSTQPSGSFYDVRVDDINQNGVLVYDGFTNPI